MKEYVMGVLKGFTVGVIILTMLIVVCSIVNAETVIVDNGEAGTSFTGNWQASSGPDPYGGGSLYSKVVGDTYTFETTVNGTCEVSVWWTEWSSRATDISVGIYNGEVLLDTVHVDQTMMGGQWNVVGTYVFTDVASVMITSEGNSKSTCADAIRVEQQGDIVDMEVTVTWTRPDSAGDWAGLWIRINGDDSTVVNIVDPEPTVWTGTLSLNIGENIFEMLAYDSGGQHSKWSEPAYYTPGQEILWAPIGISIEATE